ncbi:MAG TPA: HEXXH motif-containing putative peptide modification protein [Pyrinomonadaceae bacterium]|nr:HEXXH motif-containing putative peptide modification protein [Pyrinomonadaceae bacterium]
MILKLPLIFTWRRRDGLAKAIYDRYVARREEDGRIWVERMSERAPQPFDSLIRELDNLPAQSRRRFFTAPQTYRQMNRNGSAASQRKLAFISESLRAERHLLDPRAPRSAPAWTALGDYFFPAEVKGVEPVRDYAAPRIMEHIVVDAFSPYSEVAVPGGTTFKPSHTPEELSLIIGRLNEAANGIDDVSPLITDLVASVTKAIALKRDPEAPESFGSSSWSSAIGKMALTNAHVGNVGSAQIANALVHESIHSLLYMIEIENPFYLDEASVCEFKLQSPWTGRMLYISSFLHACFVWFGLACFWRMAEDSQAFLREESANCLARACAGFHKGSILKMLTEAQPHLKTELLEAIETMQRALGGTV